MLSPREAASNTAPHNFKHSRHASVRSAYGAWLMALKDRRAYKARHARAKYLHRQHAATWNGARSDLMFPLLPRRAAHSQMHEMSDHNMCC